MSDAFPYLRRVELDIYGVPGWQNKHDSAKKQFLIVGDGTPEGMRIRFNIHKAIPSTATPSTISIYNLSQDLRDALRGPDNKKQSAAGVEVRLRVGWNNIGMMQIFAASVKSVRTERDGPDLVTTLTGLSGYGGLRRAKTPSTPWVNGTPISKILTDLVEEIDEVDDYYIDIKDSKVGKSGYSATDSIEKHLNELAFTYKFSWGILDRTFWAIDDSKYFPSDTLISSRNGTLLRCEPMVAGIDQVLTGWSVQSILHPNIRAGHSFTLESTLNPKLNGTHKVHTLNHIGDTHSNAWNTNIESWRIF